MKPMRDLINPANNIIPFDIETVDGEIVEEDGPECVTCNDLGMVSYAVPVGHPDFGKVFPCPAEGCPTRQRNEQARYQALVNKAPLPPEYADLSFASWERLSDHDMTGKLTGYTAAILFAERADSGYWFRLQDLYDRLKLDRTPPNPYEKNSLVLAGPPGIGKTSLAACIVNALRPRHIPALYERVSNILDALREPFNKGQDQMEFDYGRTEQQILSTFSRAPVLILDEFNLARASDYSRQKLEDIIRHRMAAQLPTVMTTNLDSFDAFNEHWGLRVGHAVQGMAHWIVMGGPELRRRGGEVRSV